MTFRVNEAIKETNQRARTYLTKNLADVEAGVKLFDELIKELGNSIDQFPEWHPIVANPVKDNFMGRAIHCVSAIDVYRGFDHTMYFATGMITCPYNEQRSKNLVEKINQVPGLYAYQLKEKLYADNAYPVVVQAANVELEADGTIKNKQALAYCLKYLADFAEHAEVAETWWSMKSSLLGEPSGARSSIVVNQHTGNQIKKMLEALNSTGVYGEIKESSLEMLSEKKRKKITETLIMAAYSKYDGKEDFEFLLRDETVKANVRDTFEDGYEFHINIIIGNFDLSASGFYYPEDKIIQTMDPRGKKALALKFL